MKLKNEAAPVGSWAITNCWSTSYAILRQAQNSEDPFVVFYVGNSASSYISGETYSRPVLDMGIVAANVPPVSSQPDRRNVGLQPGDMLVIRQSGTIHHMAMFVDDDVYFEKTGPGGGLFQQHLYRFIDFETLRSYEREGASYIVRRFDQTPLPSVEAAFGAPVVLENGTTRSVIREGGSILPITPLSFEYDLETGRARLPPSAFETGMFTVNE